MGGDESILGVIVEVSKWGRQDQLVLYVMIQTTTIARKPSYREDDK
jgi:hypothetical protein